MNGMRQVARVAIREEAESFARFLDADPAAYREAREALMRFAAYRAARRPYCFRNSFARLRASVAAIPRFQASTAGWPLRSVNLCLGLASEALWMRASEDEQQRLLSALR